MIIVKHDLLPFIIINIFNIMGGIIISTHLDISKIISDFLQRTFVQKNRMHYHLHEDADRGIDSRE